MSTKATKCQNLVVKGHYRNEDGEMRSRYDECGAAAVTTTKRFREVPDGSRGHIITETVCSVCDAPEEVGTCDGCGAKGNFWDGLCYRCQCDAHANGEYDMDGEGFRF